MKYIQSKNGYYYKVNSKGVKTRISKNSYMKKTGGAHIIYTKNNNVSTVEINETKKHYKLQEDALTKAIEFYKQSDNYHNIFKITKGFNKYYVIPVDLDKNKFILIKGNLKRWKFIQQRDEKPNIKIYNSNNNRKVKIKICNEKSCDKEKECTSDILNLSSRNGRIVVNVCVKENEIIFSPMENIRYITDSSLSELTEYMDDTKIYTLYVPNEESIKTHLVDTIKNYNSKKINKRKIIINEK